MTLVRSTVLLLAVLLGLSTAQAAVTLNLKDADINTLIATVSEVTGKNFIVDTRVKGKITVISSSPMTPDSVYQTFLAVLEVNGFAAIPSPGGGAIKIIPDTNAKTDGSAPNASGAGLPAADVVTHVYQIQNISAAQLVPILRPLIPQWGHLAAYAPSNMLIITDRAANVQRMEQLIRQMDQSGDRGIEIIKLQFAAAGDVVRVLTSLTQQDKAADPSAKAASVIADERSNSVLLGGDLADRQRLRAIVAQLDTQLPEDGTTQVVYLRYASAENLAPILEGYAQQQARTAARTATPATAAPSAPATGGSADGQSRILADKDTNALVITATPKTMRALRNVIAQLDIKRAQVLVETIIAEVSAVKASQLGIDWALYQPNVGGATGLNTASTLSALTTAATASNPLAGAASALGSGLVAATGVIRSKDTSFGILVRALQSDGDTNVLSTPSIVATDNEESKISVGQEVPFLTGQFSNTGAGSNIGASGVVNPFQTIERKDVGLSLGLTPQINEGNDVQMKLKLEVSDVSSGAGTVGTASLVTNKRAVETVVSVESGQVLVLGGLLDDRVLDSESGIPFFSSLPLIGWLFQSRSVNKQKRNLMVFIRPAILTQRLEADYYTRRKYDFVRQQQLIAPDANKPTPLSNSSPALPPFESIQQNAPPATAK